MEASMVDGEVVGVGVRDGLTGLMLADANSDQQGSGTLRMQLWLKIQTGRIRQSHFTLVAPGGLRPLGVPGSK